MTTGTERPADSPCPIHTAIEVTDGGDSRSTFPSLGSCQDREELPSLRKFSKLPQTQAVRVRCWVLLRSEHVVVVLLSPSTCESGSGLTSLSVCRSFVHQGARNKEEFGKNHRVQLWPSLRDGLSQATSPVSPSSIQGVLL